MPTRFSRPSSWRRAATRCLRRGRPPWRTRGPRTSQTARPLARPCRPGDRRPPPPPPPLRDISRSSCIRSRATTPRHRRWTTDGGDPLPTMTSRAGALLSLLLCCAKFLYLLSSWLVFLHYIGTYCTLIVEESGARFTKYLTIILRLSYDNAKVTIDLRRSSGLQNILRRTQGCF